MDKLLTLLDTTITAAVSAEASTAVNAGVGSVTGLTVVIALTYGSGGTSGKVWVQTSLDGGATWVDIACMAFTTASKKRITTLSARTPVTTHYDPTDGTLSDDTSKDGILGPLYRTKLTTVGTYAGSTTLEVLALVK